MLGFFHGPVAGDLGPASGNGFLHRRRCQHFTVQGDGNTLANIPGRNIRELSAAFIGKFHGYQGLVSITYYSFCVFQIRTGQYRYVIGIFKLKHGCLAQHINGFFRIFNARQFHDDTVTALTLYNRFRQSQCVNAALNDMSGTVQRIVIDLQLWRIHSLQYYMGPALQIQALFDRTCQRPDIHAESPDYCQSNNQELP